MGQNSSVVIPRVDAHTSILARVRCIPIDTLSGQNCRDIVQSSSYGWTPTDQSGQSVVSGVPFKQMPEDWIGRSDDVCVYVCVRVLVCPVSLLAHYVSPL